MLVPTIAFYLSSRRTQRSRSRSVGLEDGSDSDSDGDDGFAPNDGDDPSASWGIADAPYKMVLCVNTSLGMGKGARGERLGDERHRGVRFRGRIRCTQLLFSHIMCLRCRQNSRPVRPRGRRVLQAIPSAVPLRAPRVGTDGVRQNSGEVSERGRDGYDTGGGRAEGNSSVFRGGRGEDADRGGIADRARVGPGAREGVRGRHVAFEIDVKV